MTGPPDDPSDRPTGITGYGAENARQQVLEHEPERAAEDPDTVLPGGAPEPWYRSRVLLALWALMLALLLTLVIYGIVELSRGGGQTRGPATTTTSSTAPARSSATTPPSTTPAASTTTDTAPPPETPEQTADQAPPPTNNSPAPAGPSHHHHPHIPSTITLPHTVVTLPHGF